MSMLKEFKEFAMRGNVVDMAVGIIIGGAFGKIVSSLVNDLIMPPIGLILGGVDFRDLALTLRAATAETSAVSLNYGVFINTVIDFLIVAGAIFLVIHTMKRFAKKEVPAAKTKDCPECLMPIPIQAKRCGHCSVQLS
jgi:large conductance mechanosensitive channel